MNERPLVTVVTPVYNGEAYLEACIESVLRQTYENWEYVIVDNASTDRSGEIAESFAARDPRIRVLHNAELLPMLDNLNLSMRQVPPQSRWCKVVHADDLLFPECLEAMVAVGEAHPGAGIIGAYSQWGDRVACDGLPYPSPCTPGRELARLVLLGAAYPFLSPSSLLIRSDLVRARDPFYPGSEPHADVQVLYELLRETDFGFVHQVLTFVRRHDDSTTNTGVRPMLRLPLQRLDLLARYGPEFLSPEELEPRMAKLMGHYYRTLARQPYRARSEEFWALHRGMLQRMGQPFSLRRFLAARLENLTIRAVRRLTRLQ